MIAQMLCDFKPFIFSYILIMHLCFFISVLNRKKIIPFTGAVEKSSKHGSDEKSQMILNHIKLKMEKRVIHKKDVFQMIR